MNAKRFQRRRRNGAQDRHGGISHPKHEFSFPQNASSIVEGVKKKKKGGRKGLRVCITNCCNLRLQNLKLCLLPIRPTTDSCQPSFRTSVAALELLLIALYLSVALSFCSVLRLSRFNIRHEFSKSRHMSTSAGWTMKGEHRS